MTVPIVIAAIEYDPIDLGLVTSIARPGRNVTGVIFNQLETSGKRVELLKEAVQLDETERAARSLGISFRIIEQSVPPDYDRAFEIAGFEARFEPYQSTRLSRYTTAPELGCGYAAT
jgi:putative tryptophan/tyrosine transport system substrate-binding protein